MPLYSGTLAIFREVSAEKHSLQQCDSLLPSGYVKIAMETGHL